MSRNLAFIAVVLCIAVLFVAACTQAVALEAPLTPVAVQLAWTHQAQFAGLYAADQQGFFADEGIAVTFIPGGSGIDEFAPIIDGVAQFGVAGADEILLARAGGGPVKAIATVYRRSPVVFVSLAEKNITRPQDFVGLTIRTSSNLQTLRAMMAKVGIADDQYEVVDLPSDLSLFATGEVPVWGVYLNAFVVSAEQAGYELNQIFPDDYGVHFYSDSLFTSDQLIAEQPDLVLRFLRAALQGWTYVVENPDEVAAMVQKYKPDADLAVEDARMIASLPLVSTGEDNIGWMEGIRWEEMAQTLRDQGILTNPLDVGTTYTMQFLEEIYGQ